MTTPSIPPVHLDIGAVRATTLSIDDVHHVDELQALHERCAMPGLKSRMDLFRKALGAYPAGAGETELAAAFSTDA